jgi:hypothetical protein
VKKTDAEKSHAKIPLSWKRGIKRWFFYGNKVFVKIRFCRGILNLISKFWTAAISMNDAKELL